MTLYQASYYLSVRDIESYENLVKCSQKIITIVPDSAILIQ